MACAWRRRFSSDVANAYLHDDQLRDNPPIPMDAARRDLGHAANLQRHIHDSNLPENVECLKDIRRHRGAARGPFVFGEFSEGFERSGAYLPSDVGLHASIRSDAARPSPVARIRAQEIERDDAPSRLLAMRHAFQPRHHRTVTRFGGGARAIRARKAYAGAAGFRARNVLMYQGEELGLPEVRPPPRSTGGSGRDIYYPTARAATAAARRCRGTPTRRTSASQAARPGFPSAWRTSRLRVSEQEGDADSTLNFARAFLVQRKKSAALRLGQIAWVDTARAARRLHAHL